MKKTLLLFLFLPILLFSETTNNYKIAIGEDIYYSSFSTVTTDSLILYIYRHEAEEQINYYNFSGTTQRFTLKDSTNNIDLIAIKDGNNIFLKGISDGKDIDTIIKIDESPWKQSMSYSLSEFTLGKKIKLNSGSFDLINLKVKKCKPKKQVLKI